MSDTRSDESSLRTETDPTVLVVDPAGRILEGALPFRIDREDRETTGLLERVNDPERRRNLAGLLAKGAAGDSIQHTTVVRDEGGEPRMVDLELAPEGKDRIRVALTPFDQPFRTGGMELSEAVFHAGVGIIITDAQANIQRVNPAFSEVTGFAPEEVIGRNPRALQSGLQDATFYRAMWETLRATGEWSGEIWNRRRNGAIYPEWLNIRAITDSRSGAVRHYVGTFSDLSQQVGLEDALGRIVEGLQGRLGEAFFTGVTEQAAHILGADFFFVGVLHGEGQQRIRTLAFYGEGRFLGNMDYHLEGTPCARVVGKSACTFTAGVARQFPQDPPLQEMGIEAYSGVPLFDSRGRPLGILVALFREPLSEPKRTENLLKLIAARTASEIERSRQEERIQHLAYLDTVTELPNRALFRDRLQQQMALNHREDHFLALLLLDLDNFKSINDTLGHAAGDEVLRQLGRRLADSLREGDTVARLGGDELVILLPEFATVSGAERGAARVAEKIGRALAQPFAIQGHRITAQASIGIAVHPSFAQTFDDLLKQADTAMYQAKGEPGHRYRFFNPGMGRDVAERLELEEALQEAVARGELEVYLQPRATLTATRVVGAEALLRWTRPGKGEVPPSRFIPLAEESALIHPLGRFVLHSACRWLADNYCVEGRCGDIRTLSVNISPVQFRAPDFVEEVTRAIREEGADPRCLELELTEGVLVDSFEEVAAKLNALKELGIRISIDDFGTGYSSLAYLKHLPVDTLKIDRTFIVDLLEDPDSQAIVGAIAALAAHLGLAVCAEGIESAEQQDYLRSVMPEATFQGFLFAPPLPPCEVPDLAG